MKQRDNSDGCCFKIFLNLLRKNLAAPSACRPGKSLQIWKPDTKNVQHEEKQEVDEENWIWPRPDKCGSDDEKKNKASFLSAIQSSCFSSSSDLLLQTFSLFSKLGIYFQLLIAFQDGRSCFLTLTLPLHPISHPFNRSY